MLATFAELADERLAGVPETLRTPAALQAALNPPRADRPEIERFGMRFRVGDKVIQTRNNYDKNVFNGDFGVVLGQNEEGTLLIDFDGARVELERGEQGDLHLAYAVSIHKSQGSEFPAVVVPLLRQHSIMLARNLVYTAVTRGRKQVILVGDPTAYAMAVRNASDSRRITGLLPRLRGEE